MATVSLLTGRAGQVLPQVVAQVGAAHAAGTPVLLLVP